MQFNAFPSSSKMSQIYQTTLAATTQSIVLNSVLIKEEIAIYFHNLKHTAASGTCGIALQFNNINTGNIINMVQGTSNVQPSNTSYTYDGVIYGRRNTDKSWIFTIAGANSGANVQGTTVAMGELQNSNIGDLTQLFISCSSYGTYSMNTGTVITVFGR